MKKIIICSLLIVSTSALVAQNQQNTQVQQSFIANNPGATNIKWLQVNNDWWQVSYMNNNQVMHNSYNANGASTMVALPVTETHIFGEVVNKLNSMFGPEVYDITAIKEMNQQDEYVVRIM